MLKIATHDSATGEKGNWWSWLFIPFAKTQTKTIKEQYDAGCRDFDIRIRKVCGKWKCAHGLWVTSRTAEDIIKEINNFTDKCSVMITYEGGYKDNDLFISYVQKLKSLYTHIGYGRVAVKYGKDSTGVKVKYDYILDADKDWRDAPAVQGFLPLDGRSWHIYLPIPWLWDRIYKRPHVFNEEYYVCVDFL